MTFDRAITVVIPHFGDPGPTLILVDALKAQRPSSDTGPETVKLQIIVVDDCSPAPFPKGEGIHIVRRSRNGGFGSAVNSGIALAEHDLVLVLNSDLEISPTFVDDLLNGARPWQPAVVSPQVLGHDGSGQWVGRHFPVIRHQAIEWLTPLARFRHSGAMREAVGHDTRCVTGSVVPVDWVVGAAMLIPVEQFRAVGGFDEDFYMNSEEVDLQRRMRVIGVPSIFLGTVCVTHEGGGSSDPARRRQWLVESRLRYAKKWGHLRGLQCALIAASIANLLVNCGRQLAGRRVNALRTLRQELGYLGIARK